MPIPAESEIAPENTRDGRLTCITLDVMMAKDDTQFCLQGN
jgi:hypothetical protein